MRVAFFLFCLLFSIVELSSAMDFEKSRLLMVEKQIAARGVQDPQTLRALRKVARHKFVPPELSDSAYQDRALPIGYGQTISQPYIVGYMTEQLELESDDKVLEIGTGSGYQAAILGEIAGEVYTLEIIHELASRAEERLKSMGCSNITVYNQDGYFGLESKAPFDSIIVTAAAEFIPPPLIKQLKDGGRMIIPVGSPFGIQWLMLINKKSHEITSRRLIPVSFVPLTRE